MCRDRQGVRRWKQLATQGASQVSRQACQECVRVVQSRRQGACQQVRRAHPRCTPSTHTGVGQHQDGTRDTPRLKRVLSTSGSLPARESMKPLPCVPASRKGSPASITPAARLQQQPPATSSTHLPACTVLPPLTCDVVVRAHLLRDRVGLRVAAVAIAAAGLARAATRPGPSITAHPTSLATGLVLQPAAAAGAGGRGGGGGGG